MHEMALVHPIVDTVLEHAASVGAAEVSAVHLTIGDGRDVIEDYMQGLFTFLARGTVAENAKLVITHVPYTVRCNECGHVFPLNVRDSSTWTCPGCGAHRNYHLHSGMEFTLDQIVVARFADSAVA
ncbi:hydrogenase maturation nickel metallochaperone HypA/HybF [Adlercreutzia shanghongiae]|uniref:Hydrogenase maturation factor HypA n=1 Tax=Adlercreutzia shanghongiae TaxID=3111773 RepID=A0ABU6IZU5_9ACTN|nr:hydrogenase maturation nickel metallochaperone HypA [Adlercreutzia sp. R22]MEC4295407.1 hydrogenase maturation nickel metallochaperone HypA [Adlercreutzia sp. R22]